SEQGERPGELHLELVQDDGAGGRALRFARLGIGGQDQGPVGVMAGPYRGDSDPRRIAHEEIGAMAGRVLPLLEGRRECRVPHCEVLCGSVCRVSGDSTYERTTEGVMHLACNVQW